LQDYYKFNFVFVNSRNPQIDKWFIIAILGRDAVCHGGSSGVMVEIAAGRVSGFFAEVVTTEWKNHEKETFL
jgi:hypothetical protein